MNIDSINRRDFLKLGAIGAAGAGIIPSLGASVKSAPLKAKAKTVIQVWLWGGPCHIDTFDPKPNAGKDYSGPYNTALDTNVDHIKLNPHLKGLSKIADKFSLIRSMTHGINAHETASYMVQTGHKPGRLVYPSMGAVVSQMKGYDSGYKGIVPPYIVLTEPQGRFSEAGFLGPKHKPFCTSGDPSKTPFVVEGIVAKGITDKRQRSRRGLLSSLDSLGGAMSENELFQLHDQRKQQAYDLMFGDAKKLFDLSLEKEATRERYGMTKFGQSCLMARRLAEEGVRHITINHKGWDTHKQHFQLMDRMLPELDQGLSALLLDLSQSGLLDETIVICGGEFGRSPKVQWKAPWNGGRGHFGTCFSTFVAGGGFKGGNIVGASDERGLQVAERPVHPQDLISSVYTLMGIDPNAKLPNPRGLDVKVMSPEGGSGMLNEIM